MLLTWYITSNKFKNILTEQQQYHTTAPVVLNYCEIKDEIVVFIINFWFTDVARIPE